MKCSFLYKLNKSQTPQIPCMKISRTIDDNAILSLFEKRCKQARNSQKASLKIRNDSAAAYVRINAYILRREVDLILLICNGK